jgi:hypothetical protein
VPPALPPDESNCASEVPEARPFILSARNPRHGPGSAMRRRRRNTRGEALLEPFSAFPSWFMRIECDRCGKVQIVNESHAKWRNRTLRDILAKMRHDGCGGLAAKAELLTGVEGVSSRPVWRIVLTG